jgi:predicted GNAT superfamily acetyltransferase
MADRITIRSLSSIDDMKQAEELQRHVWPGSETLVLPDHTLIALHQHGGLTLGAFEGDKLVGMVIGFLGTDSESPNRPAMARLKHHSHMLGVHPDYRDQGIGHRLKLEQRMHAIRNGIRLITWTYDPLQSRNAYLNIQRLGTICRTYRRDYYGEMRDAINKGVHSDRFQVEWWVTSQRVKSRVEQERRPLDLANFLGAGVLKVNPTILREDDFIEPPEEHLPLEGTLLLAEIPSNIDEIRLKAGDLAETWTMHVRALFEHAFAKGYIITDFVYLKGETVPRSYYVLSHGESTFG